MPLMGTLCRFVIDYSILNCKRYKVDLGIHSHTENLDLPHMPLSLGTYKALVADEGILRGKHLTLVKVPRDF